MPRQKGQEKKQTIESRTRRLRNRFKRVHTQVVPANEKAFTAFLVYCEKKLDTFDPQHVKYVDRAALEAQAALEAKRLPKKLVPLQVVEVVHEKKNTKKAVK